MTISKIDLKYEPDRLIVEIIGDITAQTNFPQLPRSDIKELVIDLGQIGYVNSGGILTWKSWINAVNLAFRGVGITFKNLSSISARQASQVKDYLPNGANIYSFIVPYFCASCNLTTNILYQRGVNWNSSLDTDEKIRKLTYAKCSSCKAMVEIDAIPEHYAGF
jgi:hypothetical protein